MLEGHVRRSGKLLGGLKDASATDLGGYAIAAALERSGVSPEHVDYVVMGTCAPGRRRSDLSPWVEGNLKARASAENASGFWKDMINNINGLVDSIAVPVLEVGKVLKNISRGNLDETFQIPVSGDFKVMAETINRTIDNLNLFAGEVTRVALEVVPKVNWVARQLYQT